MNEFFSITGIFTVLFLGTMSPGPSFVIVARTAVAQSRSSGVAAALGMGLGGVMFASVALLGLQSLLSAVPDLYLMMKIVGGLYLIYLGIRILTSAGQSLDIDLSAKLEGRSHARSFLVGFATQISNPKTAVVYASVFAAFLSSELSMLTGLLILCSVFIIETGWYSIVAIVLSTSKSRRAYLSYKTVVDRLAGIAMIGLGCRLLATANQRDI